MHLSCVDFSLRWQIDNHQVQDIQLHFLLLLLANVLVRFSLLLSRRREPCLQHVLALFQPALTFGRNLAAGEEGQERAAEGRVVGIADPGGEIWRWHVELLVIVARMQLGASQWIELGLELKRTHT